MRRIMISADEMPVRIQVTPRREAREGYCRYLLLRAGFDEEQSTAILGKQTKELYGCSPIELIYSGRYDMAVEAIEYFVDNLPEKED